jgi:hypothetical protein
MFVIHGQQHIQLVHVQWDGQTVDAAARAAVRSTGSAAPLMTCWFERPDLLPHHPLPDVRGHESKEFAHGDELTYPLH